MSGATAQQARLVIAAPQGRSGKTTVSLGICAALRGRGLVVQPFKKGPDYIDPSWLSAAAGTPCRSLDPYFYPSRAELRAAFVQGSRQAEFCLVEGNHGLYDSSLGPDGLDDGEGSTAAVARTLEAPILLVLNTTRMSRSAAAMVQGYQHFEPGTPLAGVILNNVAQSRHEDKLRTAIERYTGLPVVGAMPRQESIQIPDRHLGLVPISESPDLHPAILACRQAAERYLNLEQILAIARSAPPRVDDQPDQRSPAVSIVRIGIVRDRAFNFYYPENLEALEQAGAELVYLDALNDPGLPVLDGLVIGGGFPEMFLDELERNISFKQELWQAIEAGLPVYAECGGLMYLSRAITWGERRAVMVGALPFEVEMESRPQGHGYAAAQVKAPNPFFPVGSQLRGHEFHHSRLIQSQAASQQEVYPAYRLLRGSGLHGSRTGAEAEDGLVYRNVLASYIHLHAGGSPDWAPGLVQRALAFARFRESVR
jgi:cobyrinic acid a,c-diamide synthase